jgi:DNA-binding transcriptional LysR family regulator
MIDLRRLQVLRVLAEHGTVTAAAAALRLTPSAVSQQIRQLSRDLGVDLLSRDGRGVRLTAAAERLLDRADGMYAQWEEIESELSTLGQSHGGVLRMVGFPTALGGLLAPAAVRLRHTHPQLRVQLTEAETTECFPLLLDQRADIALIVPLPDNPPPDDPRFRQVPLLDDPQDLIVPSGHPLHTADSVTLADAANEDWIAAPDSIDQHQLILAACNAAGFAPRIVHHAQEWNAICALTAHGLGVCLVPRLAPIATPAAVRIPLTGNPQPFRRILICTRRGSQTHPALGAGIQALTDVARHREATNDSLNTIAD